MNRVFITILLLLLMSGCACSCAMGVRTTGTNPPKHAEGELVISSLDSKYTPLGPKHAGWREYPLPGYLVSSIHQWGPMQCQGEADPEPLVTRVDGLSPDTYYVYLRYQGVVKVKLAGAGNEQVTYGPFNSDRLASSFSEGSPTPESVFEVYLGAVHGDTIEVTVGGNHTGHTLNFSTYDGLILRTQKFEEARLPERRQEVADRLGMAAERMDRLAFGLEHPLTQSAAFDDDRRRLAVLKVKLNECRRLLGSARTPAAINLCERNVAIVERGALSLHTGRSDLNEVTDDQKWFDSLANNVHNAEERAKLAAAMARSVDADGDGMVVFHCDALGRQFSINQVPAPDAVDKPLNVFACPGQYEPVGFAVLAARDLSAVRVHAGALKSKNDELPSSALNVRFIEGHWNTGLGGKTLVNYHLVKNDRIVEAQLDEVKEVFADDIFPARDSTRLCGTDIPAGTLKQYFLNVHVPEDQPAGEYTGNILIESAHGARVFMPVRVEVLPFQLPKPMLDYGWYYWSHLSSVAGYDPWASGMGRTKEQTIAELRNMVEHGCNTMVLVTETEDQSFKDTLWCAKQAGMPVNRILWWGTWQLIAALREGKKSLEDLDAFVRKFVAAARDVGCGDVYFYLQDEGSEEMRKMEPPYCDVIHAAGGKTVVTDNAGGTTMRILGGKLDHVLLQCEHDSGCMEFYQGLGRKAYSYMAPNVEVMTPLIYRRQYGLRAWAIGYDGACPLGWVMWPYADWRTFSKAGTFMVMRTSDGVIDTVQGEGWLAGVNDVRYLTALLEAIKYAKAAGRADRTVEAEAYIEWLRSTVPSGDYQLIRRKLADYTIQLRSLTPGVAR